MSAVVIVAMMLLPAPAGEAPFDAASEVDKGAKAYNARDIKYYEGVLAPDAVYIAEDGAVIAGKERVLRLFNRIFTAEPPRQVAAEGVVTGSKGDVAWARFKWTLTIGSEVRKGLATTLFVRGPEGWKVVQIQNTPDGHAMAATGKH